ncbi:MAG: DNA repair protein RadC [Candidatus Krumholzibacteria bacterium]|nr:DNA repair protein RadC [Candidatus Krumholzibacteria bacterium]
MQDAAGPSLETVRSKGRLRGLGRLSDAELLALVIGQSAVRPGLAIAGELLESCGGLEGIAAAGVEELVRRPGIGRAGALRLQASFELGRRRIVAERERMIRKVRCPEDVAGLMIPDMMGLDREHFKAILLNTKNGILKIVTVAVGSLNAALVHPREIFKAAVAASAAGIIVVHNHPTGNPEPSREDTDLTLRFARCGELMGIDLVDHIIIGGEEFVSMRERGLVTP